MLQIRLSKPASESGGARNPVPTETVTVACPDHLVLADLPVAKGLGSACATAVTKTIGRRSRRQLGERVHFCVQCDFPIAVYGRLSPCEHAFCLDCARSDSLCYLCDERVQKIQTIKMMEGIFICAAPHCLKSFLKKSDFESHIKNTHGDLLHPNKEKDGNESEAMSSRKPSASDSTVQAPPRSVFSPSSNSQVQDRDDKTSRAARSVMQQRPMPPFHGQVPTNPSEQQPFDGAAPQNHFSQPGFDPHDGQMNPNIVMPPPQFGYAPYPSDGTQQFYNAPSYEMLRQDSLSEPGQDQGSTLGFIQGGHLPMNFPQNYPRPWNIQPGSVPLEPPMVSQGNNGGFSNVDPQGQGFFPPPPPFAPPPRVRSYSGYSNLDAPPGFGWPSGEG